MVLLTLASISAFVFLRFAVNRESSAFSLADFFAFRAPLPYGGRVFPAFLARPLMDCLGCSARHATMIMDAVALGVIVWSLLRILRTWMTIGRARFAALGVLLALSPAYLIEYRWPVLFAYDFPATAFCAVGLLVAVEQRRRILPLLTALAALNKETAAFLPILYIVFNLGRERPAQLARIAAMAFGSLVVVRIGVALALMETPGPRLSVFHGEVLRLWRNLEWLTSGGNALVLLGTLSGLPVAYWILRHRMEPRYRVVGSVVLCFMVIAAMLGNLYEPRLFGEAIVMLYLSVCAGAFQGNSWLANHVPVPCHRGATMASFLARWGLVVTAGLSALACAVVLVAHRT